MTRRLSAAILVACVALAASLCPRDTLVALGFYMFGGFLVLLAAVVALWPILEDVFVEPRRRRNWRREIARDNHPTARGHRH